MLRSLLTWWRNRNAPRCFGCKCILDMDTAPWYAICPSCAEKINRL